MRESQRSGFLNFFQTGLCPSAEFNPGVLLGCIPAGRVTAGRRWQTVSGCAGERPFGGTHRHCAVSQKPRHVVRWNSTVERDHHWPEAFHLGHEPRQIEVVGRYLRVTRFGPSRHNIGQPDALLQNRPVFRVGDEQTAGESGGLEQLPEAIALMSVVMTSLGRRHALGAADNDNPNSRYENVCRDLQGFLRTEWRLGEKIRRIPWQPEWPPRETRIRGLPAGRQLSLEKRHRVG